MGPPKRILIIGGSVAGLSAGIMCRHAGYDVDIAEIDPNWQVSGAGITVNGSTLRALAMLGVLGEVLDRGFFAHGNEVYDTSDRLLQKREGLVLPRRNLPTGGGVLRPVLHEILSEKALRSGVNVRLGLTYHSLREVTDGVEVEFTDGGTGRYDLAIAADGLFSPTRSLLFPEAPAPRFTGQGCWRAVTTRPRQIACGRFYNGAPHAVGAVPVSRDEMYVWVLENTPTNPWVDPADQPRLLAELLAPFEGVLADVRDALNENSRIIYRPLETVLVSTPWHKGRVLLIGDAAHGTTPHLASGAGLAIEDGIAIAEELMAAATIEQAFAAFYRRRYSRCELVVNGSVAIGEAQIDGDPAKAQSLFPPAWSRLAEPF